MMHTHAMLAEIDPVQIAIIVLAMLGGFVQWLWGLIKQQQEESERRRQQPLSEEEKRLREEAWQRQVQPNQPAPKPSPKSMPPVNDPWSSVRDIFEQLQKNTPPPPAPTRQQPPRPVQLPNTSHPSRPVPGTVRAELQPPPIEPVVTVAPVPVSSSVTAPFSPSPSAPAPAESLDVLRHLLGTTASIRQAVLMREILGPPKALQSSGDSPF